MTEAQYSQQGTPTPQKKGCSPALKWGCGIGCGLVILLIVIAVGMGYYFLKDTITSFEETERTTKLLQKKFGEVGKYTPDPYGAITTERIEAFLKIREGIAPMAEEFRESAYDFVKLIKEVEEKDRRGEDSFSDAVAVIRKIGSIMPKFARYLSTRNKKMIEMDMSPGEYYYLYALVYYCWLDKSPSDGPDYNFIYKDRHGQNQMEIQMEEFFRGLEKKRGEREDWEDRRLSPTGRVRAFMLPMMKRQLEKLKQVDTDQDAYEWQQTLEKEISHLDDSPESLPWQDGVPEIISKNLNPYRQDLESSYSVSMNLLEFGFPR